jgi:hypothetical protein
LDAAERTKGASSTGALIITTDSLPVMKEQRHRETKRSGAISLLTSPQAPPKTLRFGAISVSLMEL